MSPDHKTKWGIAGLLNGEIVKVGMKKGRIVSFSRGKKANIMKNIINNSDKNASVIAEFAIGTNNKARISGFILEDEKKLETVHFAFGSNVSLGGKNQSNLHLDAVMSKTDVFVDGEQIIKNGKIILP
jgi:leucyl aminopeptidase (aminopeptidase T)